MAKFGVIVNLDGITNLGTLWEALQIKGLKVVSIFPDTDEVQAPKETAISVNGLFEHRKTRIGRPRKHAKRSIQFIFDLFKARGEGRGMQWTYARDTLAKQGYAEGTASARLNELKTKYGLIEQRDDNMYYLTKLGQKTKNVP